MDLVWNLLAVVCTDLIQQLNVPTDRVYAPFFPATLIPPDRKRECELRERKKSTCPLLSLHFLKNPCYPVRQLKPVSAKSGCSSEKIEDLKLRI